MPGAGFLIGVGAYNGGCLSRTLTGQFAPPPSGTNVMRSPSPVIP